MPIYEYQCQTCGHSFDALQKLSEAPLSKCPECGKPALKKLLSTPAFQVKGKNKGAGRETGTRTRVGHNLDGAQHSHSHDHTHGHSHSHGGHSHSHAKGQGKDNGGH